MAEEAFHAEVLSLWEKHWCQNMKKEGEVEDENKEKDLSIATLPPYDPDKPIGKPLSY